MERKHKREWPALVTTLMIVLLLAPPAIYLVGYFWLAEVEEGYWVSDGVSVVHRTYGIRWLAKAYEPAGRIEERITNREVEIGYESP